MYRWRSLFSHPVRPRGQPAGRTVGEPRDSGSPAQQLPIPASCSARASGAAEQEQIAAAAAFGRSVAHYVRSVAPSQPPHDATYPPTQRNSLVSDQPRTPRPKERSTRDGSVRSASDLAPIRRAGPSRPTRRPAWQASKDSGVYISDMLAAEPTRTTVLKTRAPALIVVVEMDADPWIATTDMTASQACPEMNPVIPHLYTFFTTCCIRFACRNVIDVIAFSHHRLLQNSIH